MEIDAVITHGDDRYRRRRPYPRQIAALAKRMPALAAMAARNATICRAFERRVPGTGHLPGMQRPLGGWRNRAMLAWHRLLQKEHSSARTGRAASAHASGGAASRRVLGHVNRLPAPAPSGPPAPPAGKSRAASRNASACCAAPHPAPPGRTCGATPRRRVPFHLRPGPP